MCEEEVVEMKKIALISISLILALMVGLAGCGGGTETVTTTETVSVPTTITPAPVTETVTTMVEFTRSAAVTSPPVTDTVTETITPAPLTIKETTVVTQTVTPTPPSPVYQVVENISYIITKKSSNYWYFSWKVTIKNMHFEEIKLYLDIDFLNSAGFSLEWDIESSTFNPGETKTILGSRMISADIAGDVVKAVIEIKAY